MPISNPAPSAVLVIAETQRFVGTAPISWTDLDFNGIIGYHEALILIKIKCENNQRVAVRKNGDSDEFYDTADVPKGAAMGESASGEHIVFLVATDSSARIEWKCQNASAAATVDLMGWIR